jgi:glycerophosphoryl diester phosphodiesterase
MMVLEVKRPRWEETILEQVSDWPGIVIASFDHSVIVELRRREPTIPVGITFSGYIVDVAQYAQRLGATYCFPKFRYVDHEMVTSCHERGIRVIPWTANRKHDWERLRELGCDGVITDFPAEAVEWRGGIEN